MTGWLSRKASDGIRPTPVGSSPRTSEALVARQTAEALASVSTTQTWLPTQPAGVEVGLHWAVLLAAQRSPEAVAGSTTQICDEVQLPLQGGGGRGAESTSPPTTLPAPTTVQ